MSEKAVISTLERILSARHEQEITLIIKEDKRNEEENH